MPNQNGVNASGASASSRLPAREDGLPADAAASRLVMRDKSSRPEPHAGPDKGVAFPDVVTETATLQMGRNKQGIVVSHPIPNTKSSAYFAHVDWLGFTLLLPEERATTWLFKEIVSVFCPHVTEVKKSGWNGYAQRAELGEFGLIAWGGKAQRGTVHVEFNGTGCAKIIDWSTVGVGCRAPCMDYADRSGA